MMKNITAKIFTLISIAFIASCNRPTQNIEPCPDPARDSDAILLSTLWLQTSDEAKIAREQAYDMAWQKLQKNLELYSEKVFQAGKKPAVVLDLDETVLDNSPYEARLIQKGTSFESETWSAWVNEAEAHLIAGADEFLQKASAEGIEIFYISNRSEANLGATLKNMEQYNLPFTDSAHVLLKSDDSDKTARRNKVEAQNKIILLIGDQLGDFAEVEQMKSFPADSLSNHFVLIPNPMYGSFTRISESEKEKYPGKLEAWKQKLRTQEWEP